MQIFHRSGDGGRTRHHQALGIQAEHRAQWWRWGIGDDAGLNAGVNPAVRGHGERHSPAFSQQRRIDHALETGVELGDEGLRAVVVAVDGVEQAVRRPSAGRDRELRRSRASRDVDRAGPVRRQRHRVARIQSVDRQDLAGAAMDLQQLRRAAPGIVGQHYGVALWVERHAHDAQWRAGNRRRPRRLAGRVAGAQQDRLAVDRFPREVDVVRRIERQDGGEGIRRTHHLVGAVQRLGHQAV